ncbi:hypothetical protein K439DRAFT_1642799 [Ramaria rubella]|nr:hypothetical protein K439DRAFT_1642799 [Ramaria rubella]
MVSHSTPVITPRTNNPRPSLPVDCANPKFSEIEKLPPVKFQEILREGQTIVVGRLKIATPTHPGHAFILRRYDTGAISLTTMFKAAFPTAPEEHEKAEAAWVRANFDVTGANGSAGTDGVPKLRLNGTWIGSAVAQYIAPAYGLDQILTPLIEARPDPKQEYRKSSKTTPNGSTQVAPASSDGPTPSAPKRRRGSPVVMSPATLPGLSEEKALPVRTSPRKIVRQSPAPRSTTPLVQEAHTPGGSDETAVDADADEEADVPGPDMSQDIEDQKALIADLKAKREAAGAPTTPHNPRKRQDVDTPPLSFDFGKEQEIGERAIVHRRRVQLQANQKAAAWGTLAFAVGLGAASMLPRLFF